MGDGIVLAIAKRSEALAPRRPRGRLVAAGLVGALVLGAAHARADASPAAAAAGSAFETPSQEDIELPPREEGPARDGSEAPETTAVGEPAPSGIPAHSWLSPDASYDLTFRLGEEIWFRPSGFLQLRFTQNHRQDPPAEADANSAVFSVPRVRLILEGGITRFLSFRVRFGVLSNGTARFEQAFADFRVGPLTIRGGIFYLPASIADNATPDRIQSLDYSQYANVSSGGQAAGAGLRLALGRTRLEAYLSNGARTSFTELEDPVNARFAITGRAEVRLFGAEGFERFADESSFRGGDVALRLGVAGHYQRSGSSGDYPDGKLVQVTADATLEGSGWNAMVAGRWYRMVPASTPRTDDFGLVAQAGVFVHERIELWGRYDALYSGGEVHPVPPLETIATESFQSIDVGITGYLIPRAHRAKVGADFVYVFGPTARTFVPSSPNGGILLTEAGDQWAVRVQSVVGF